MVDHHSGLPSRPLYRGGAQEVKHADPDPALIQSMAS
jgi:hypothetical protein